MRFDAYAGNVQGSKPEEVATMCAWSVGGVIERGRPRGRYHDVFEVKDGGQPVGWVAHDGHLDTAYFEFKGERTPDTAGAIRKHWSEAHWVSRLDACEDYNDRRAYDRLLAVMDRASDPRVKSREIRPRRGEEAGRTAYWGSPTSQVMVRVYEAGKMRERLHYGKPDWVRAEAQVRPAKSVLKRAAATVAPLDVWGFSAWSARAAEELGQVDVQRFVAPATVGTFDRTTLYLARAFRRHWEEALEDFGSWECIGREFQAVWKADDDLEAERANVSTGG